MLKYKILPINRLTKVISSLKKRVRRIVFTNGCFDILHFGHISYLNKAKKLGNILVVGVNSDASVKSLKGRNRPINPLRSRMAILASLNCVNYVCPFNEPTPLSLIKKIYPDVLVKGGDWKNKEIVGADFVKSYGGRVVIVPFKKGYSTTGLIKKVNEL